jgi:adenylate cyclase class 2
MASRKEIEIKFRVLDIRALNRRLRRSRFHLETRRTRELNTLYDLPGNPLRLRGELLRLRSYGAEWLLTHKAKRISGRYKSRTERETKIGDGREMEQILGALRFRPVFRYEKFRAAWADGKGHVVVDETPIGDFGEIEGPPRWIEQTARALQIPPGDYMTDSYAELFSKWKKTSGSGAQEMTFRALGKRPR